MMSNWRSSTALSRAAGYLENEDGAATMWNLSWLLGFAIMAGVAVDSTNARRVETVMASTADVAALAGSMELESPHLGLAYAHGTYGPTVEAAAIQFAGSNMDTAEHGDYLENGDIYVGNWDGDTRTFTWGGEPVNAVRVDVGRNAEKDNRVATSLLRLTGMDHWEINTLAIAAMQLPECYSNNNALIAAGELMVTSNAVYYPDTCIHGEGGVKITNNNVWWPNTGVTAGFKMDLDLGPNQYDQYGADTEVDTGYQSLMPSAMASDAVGIARAFLDLNDNFADSYHEDYPAMRIAELQDPTQPVIELDEFTLGDSVAPSEESTWLDDGVEVASVGGLIGLSHHSDSHSGGGGGGGGDDACSAAASGDFTLDDMRGEFAVTCPGANLEEYRTYYAPCTNKLTLDGLIRNVVLVSECKVDFANDAAIENSVLIVIGAKGGESIGTASRVRFGADDTCAPGGGVRIFTTDDFNTASTTSWYDVQVYVGGDFTPAGKTSASHGLQAHVAGDIHISAQLELGGIAEAYLSESEGGPACVGEVGYDWISSDYHHVLVQ